MDRISGRSLAARLFGASPARTLALLEAAWPLAVGPELAWRTEVLGIEGGTLRVRVPDARWRKVLHRMQPQILGHLREIAGELSPRRMGFVEGGMTNPPQAMSAPSNRPQSDAAPRSGGGARGGFQGGSSLHSESGVSSPPEVKDADIGGSISDPDIRQRFLETMTRYLERSKGRSDA
jgi:hypothetical protein